LISFERASAEMAWPALVSHAGDGSQKYGLVRSRYFYFDVPGSVAKSTHAGIPWLRFIRLRTGDRAHFWPFDGWKVPPGKSAVVEVYPALWSHSIPRDSRDSHQQDAYCTAEWLRRGDLGGSLEQYLRPSLTDRERKVAEIEGWILGVA